MARYADGSCSRPKKPVALPYISGIMYAKSLYYGHDGAGPSLYKKLIKYTVSRILI